MVRRIAQDGAKSMRRSANVQQEQQRSVGGGRGSGGPLSGKATRRAVGEVGRRMRAKPAASAAKAVARQGKVGYSPGAGPPKGVTGRQRPSGKGLTGSPRRQSAAVTPRRAGGRASATPRSGGGRGFTRG